MIQTFEAKLEAFEAKLEALEAKLRGEINEVRGEIKEVRGEIKALKSDLKSEIKASENRVIKWVAIGFIGLCGVIMGAEWLSQRQPQQPPPPFTTMENTQ